MRYDERVYGVPRERFIEAVAAEGVPLLPGYVLPLYRQPLFAKRRFGPYTIYRQSHPDLDYRRLHLPATERLCAEGMWLYQSVLLGSRQEMEDIVAAFRKVHARRADLAGPPDTRQRPQQETHQARTR